MYPTEVITADSNFRNGQSAEKACYVPLLAFIIVIVRSERQVIKTLSVHVVEKIVATTGSSHHI